MVNYQSGTTYQIIAFCGGGKKIAFPFMIQKKNARLSKRKQFLGVFHSASIWYYSTVLIIVFFFSGKKVEKEKLQAH